MQVAVFHRDILLRTYNLQDRFPWTDWVSPKYECEGEDIGESQKGVNALRLDNEKDLYIPFCEEPSPANFQIKRSHRLVLGEVAG